ncbi:MAG TPA: hypothetical protein VH853_20225 [Polyangia bacterium]|nr:hypothetical protein [Polyangia bacterium]
MKRVTLVGFGLFAAAGCNNLQGLGGQVPPLVSFQVEATGDLGPLRPPGVTSDVSLQVALVWGVQWVTEPFCILPQEPGSPAAAVIAAGCRDPFGFVPNLVAASVPVTIGTLTPLPLFDPPATDVLIGDQSSRIAYASLVFYDDRDGTGTLNLSESHPTAFGGDDGPDQQNMPDSNDVIYGASFLTMTVPDQRVSFLDGTFNPMAAFYPRPGCPAPMDGFRVLGASGFSGSMAFALAAAGTLPPEVDLSQCSGADRDPGATPVMIAAQVPAEVAEVSCVERTLDGSVRYRQPPTDAPYRDGDGRVHACAPLPSFDPTYQSTLIQLVVSGLPTDHCQGLTHYTLRGCREDVSCAVPDWDFTANPPAWWPC